MVLYFETGSDRLLKLIGKKHTCEMAKRFVNFMRAYHPNMEISVAIMVGLPTEEISDIISLGDLLMECDIDLVHCNYYGHVDKHPLSVYPQLSNQVKKLHLKYLIEYIKKHYNNENVLTMCHEAFYDPSKRSAVRRLEKIAEEQKETKGRLWYGATYEHFIGNNIVVKNNQEYTPIEELNKEAARIEKQRKLTK